MQEFTSACLLSFLMLVNSGTDFLLLYFRLPMAQDAFKRCVSMTIWIYLLDFLVFILMSGNLQAAFFSFVSALSCLLQWNYKEKKKHKRKEKHWPSQGDVINFTSWLVLYPTSFSFLQRELIFQLCPFFPLPSWLISLLHCDCITTVWLIAFASHSCTNYWWRHSDSACMEVRTPSILILACFLFFLPEVSFLYLTNIFLTKQGPPFTGLYRNSLSENKPCHMNSVHIIMFA